MPKSCWGLLALSVVIVIVVLAVARPGGLGSHNMAFANPDITVSLDMDAGPNGTEPCVDIDATTTHALGDTYYVAICVTGLPGSVGVASFDVLYDDTLNTAPEVANSGKGLDDNPDGNAGTTFWGDEGFGPAFDCSGGGSAFPMGDRNIAESGPGKGDAFISCMDVTVGPWGLGDDETSGVIAVIKFVADAAGTDNLIIKPGLLGDTGSSEMGSCNPSFDYPMTCVGGEDIKVAPTATFTPTITNTPVPPTSTFTPTITNTPLPPTSTFTPTATATSTNTPTPTATRTATPTSTPCPEGGCPTAEPTIRHRTRTPTPEPTETATVPPPPPSATPVPPPPPTATPLGGVGTQLVPPETGSGSGGSGLSWALMILASALGVTAVAGGLYLRFAQVRRRHE